MAEQDQQKTKTVQDNDTLTAIFAVGLKMIKPRITQVNHSSSKGGSYLLIKKFGSPSIKLPIADNSRTRTSIGRFR
jgi:hypothetical protein